MKRISLLLLVLVLTSCFSIFGDRWDENRISGFYILERVDGVPVPAALSPEQGCNRTVNLGTLSLSGGGPDIGPRFTWTIRIVNDCLPPLPLGNPGVEEGGSWRLHSGQQLSMMSARGGYSATVEEASGQPPAVTFDYLGNSYRFRRIDDPTGVVFLKFVDQFGQPVSGVVFQTALPYGLEGGGTVMDEFGTSGHVGEWTISFTPPEGYTVPPSQANPFVLTVPDEPPLHVTITLTKL
jgi:hypothetical protein